ncbi:MAG TPA: hypothetical protein VFQ54_03620, partial [Thermomicrobiales bacterium]|nr:hypothetical protein [Thermomicrobiales bacterium]
PVDDIQAAYRQWQVCKALGSTYQQMALETDQYIREAIYSDARTMTAYTEPTINELLDRLEEADEEFGQLALSPGSVAGMSPRAIDVNGSVNASADGTYVFVDIVKVIDNGDGTYTFNPDGEMSFQLVDGVWKIDLDGQLP